MRWPWSKPKGSGIVVRNRGRSRMAFEDESGDDSKRWIRIGGYPIDRSLNYSKLNVSINTIYKEWMRNPIIRRIEQILVNYTIGDGLTITSENDLVLKTLEEFRERNELDRIEPDMVRDMSLMGELTPVIGVNKANGDCEIGFFDPTQIKKIICDPLNMNKANHIILFESGTQGDEIELDVAHIDRSGTYRQDDEVPTGANRKPETLNRYVGDIFLWQINKPLSGSRGTPDWYSIFDWCLAVEDMLFTLQDKAAIQNKLVGAMCFPDDSDAQLKERQDPNNEEMFTAPPESGEWFYTNRDIEKVIKFLSPNIGGDDMHAVVELMFSMIYAGSGIPKPWFGMGDDINRATAEEMAIPVQKWLQGRQTFILRCMKELYTYALHAKLMWGDSLSQVPEEELKFDISAPEVATKDETERAATFQTKMQGLAAAKLVASLSDETTQDLVIQTLRDAGYEIPDQPKPEENGNGEKEEIIDAARELAKPEDDN